MKADTFRRIMALVLVVMVLSTSAVRASDAVTLKPGARIAIELVSGPPVTGTIRTVEPGGVIVQPDFGEPVFVPMRSVAAYLNPDTGKVIAFPRAVNVHVVKTVCITAAIVGGLLAILHATVPVD